MTLRNFLFNRRILPMKEFSSPVISIGNLCYGGTGKTPHIEYLIRLLKPTYSLATLSRGYGRATRGFLMASGDSGVKEIGDEPVQFARKFSDVTVAVDEKRSRGATILLQEQKGIQVLLLDDAFQHRYIKPGLSLLLTDYLKLYTDDYVIPSGTLREFRSGASRADMIIVTKTPKIFSPLTRRRILSEIAPMPHQKVFFSYLEYGDLMPVLESSPRIVPPRINSILLFSGIANDYPMREHLARMCTELHTIRFADHHPYTPADIEKILTQFKNLPTLKKILVTTEKDAMRLKNPELSNLLQGTPLFYLPIQVEFHPEDKQLFDNAIYTHVRENLRND